MVLRFMLCITVSALVAVPPRALASNGTSIVVERIPRAKYIINKHYRASEYWRPVPFVLRFNGVSRLKVGDTITLPDVFTMMTTFGLPREAHAPTQSLIALWSDDQMFLYDQQRCADASARLRTVIASYEALKLVIRPQYTLASLAEAANDFDTCVKYPDDDAGKIIGGAGNALDRAVTNLLRWSIELSAEPKQPPN
jgi:hypothetical protein